MLNTKMDAYLGYGKSASEPKETENRRNGNFSSNRYRWLFTHVAVSKHQNAFSVILTFFNRINIRAYA